MAIQNNQPPSNRSDEISASPSGEEGPSASAGLVVVQERLPTPPRHVTHGTATPDDLATSHEVAATLALSLTFATATYGRTQVEPWFIPRL